MNNEKIACNNWERIGYLKAKEEFEKMIEERIKEIKYSLHLGTILEEQAGKNAFEDIETIENNSIDILEELLTKIKEMLQ